MDCANWEGYHSSLVLPGSSLACTLGRVDFLTLSRDEHFATASHLEPTAFMQIDHEWAD